MNLQLLLQTLGISGLLVALVAYLGRVLIKQLLSKDIEKFKAELNMHAFEHQIRFSKLHEKQATVIATLFAKLAEADNAIQNYIKPFVLAGDLSENDRQHNAANAINEFIHFYKKHAIYFDEATCSKLESFIGESRNILTDFQFKDMPGKSVARNWLEINKKYKTSVLNMKKDLETAFRKMIGLITSIEG